MSETRAEDGMLSASLASASSSAVLEEATEGDCVVRLRRLAA